MDGQPAATNESNNKTKLANKHTQEKNQHAANLQPCPVT